MTIEAAYNKGRIKSENFLEVGLVDPIQVVCGRSDVSCSHWVGELIT